MRFILLILILSGADPRSVVIDMATEEQCLKQAKKLVADLQKQQPNLQIATSCLDRGPATGFNVVPPFR